MSKYYSCYDAITDKAFKRVDTSGNLTLGLEFLFYLSSDDRKRLGGSHMGLSSNRGQGDPYVGLPRHRGQEDSQISLPCDI